MNSATSYSSVSSLKFIIEVPLAQKQEYLLIFLNENTKLADTEQASSSSLLVRSLILIFKDIYSLFFSLG